MTRSQAHKIEQQGRASSGAIYEEGAINDKVLGAIGGVITGAQPHLASIAPATGVHGAADAVVTCTGTGFIAGSVAYFDGLPRTTTYVSATSVTFVAPLLAAPAAKVVNVYVVNAGVLSSEIVSYTIT